MPEVMGGEDIERKLKEKLQSFLKQMQKFGTVKGFQHFMTYLRGKEEMLISVSNDVFDAEGCSGPTTPLSFSGNFASFNASFSSGHLPYDKQKLLLSGATQKSLSGFWDQGAGLPPASPSEKETSFDDNVTTFLVAGYSRYICPYVWVRSNHSRLAKFTGQQDKDKDKPLKLKSVGKWKDREVGVWDVIAELVKLSAYPPPRNPFAVNMLYFENLDPKRKLINTGSMISTLQQIISSQSEDKYYTAKVLEDLLKLTRIHYETLQAVTVSKGLPCMEQCKKELQQKQQDEMQQQRRRRLSSGRQYPADAFKLTQGYTHPYYYSN